MKCSEQLGQRWYILMPVPFFNGPKAFFFFFFWLELNVSPCEQEKSFCLLAFSSEGKMLYYFGHHGKYNTREFWHIKLGNERPR